MNSATPSIYGFTTRVIRDGLVCEADAVRSMADQLAARLRGANLSRVALCSPQVDIVAATLCACEQVGVELLLLRRMPGEGTLVSWQVGAVIQEDLSLVPTGVRGANATEFAVLLTTSGTTGVPKVARHSPKRLQGRIRSANTDGSSPKWLLAYHPASFAGMQVTLTSLIGGGTLVACTGAAVADLAASALVHGVTHISATPTFWRAFLMTLGPEAGRLPLLQATLGGESVDQAILDRLAATFPDARVTHIYASTEAGALFAVNDGKAGFPASWLEESVDGVDLRIRDEILEVRSPRAMSGYLFGSGQSPLTGDGWLNTNDLVAVRDDRVLFLGRKDSVINVGGAKVNPDEVEAVLLRAEGVTDVRVIGVRNSISGELVCAEMVVEHGRNADVVRRGALALVRRELASCHVPRMVRIVESIDYSDTGKKSRT